MTPLGEKSSDNSSYPLLLAYTLLVLSLLTASMGTVGRPFLAASSRNNAGASATASKASFDSHPRRSTASMFEQSAVNSSAAIGTAAQDEKARRIAALALVVYAIGNGIRR